MVGSHPPSPKCCCGWSKIPGWKRVNNITWAAPGSPWVSWTVENLAPQDRKVHTGRKKRPLEFEGLKTESLPRLASVSDRAGHLLLPATSAPSCITRKKLSRGMGVFTKKRLWLTSLHSVRIRRLPGVSLPRRSATAAADVLVFGSTVDVAQPRSLSDLPGCIPFPPPPQGSLPSPHIDHGTSTPSASSHVPWGCVAAHSVGVSWIISNILWHVGNRNATAFLHRVQIFLLEKYSLI